MLRLFGQLRQGFPYGKSESAIGGLGVCLRENGGGLYCIIALLLLLEEVEKKVESSWN